MKSKRTLKICVDIAMITALLFLMAYSLIGETAHEWIGIAMLILFVMHHMLNSRWARLGENHAFTLCLLGICGDEPSYRISRFYRTLFYRISKMVQIKEKIS